MLKVTIYNNKDTPMYMYQNDTFKSWLEQNDGKSYKLVKDYGDTVRLQGVNFLVSKEYIHG